MENLQNLDWIVLGLVCYGLTAGFVRGFLQQFTRVLALIAALLLAGAWNPAVTWLTSAFSETPQETSMVQADVEVLVVCVGFLFFLWLRSKILGWLGSSSGADSRAAGAIAGLFGVLLLVSVFLGHQSRRMASSDFQSLLSVKYMYLPTSSAFEHVNAQFRPSLLVVQEPMIPATVQEPMIPATDQEPTLPTPDQEPPPSQDSPE